MEQFELAELIITLHEENTRLNFTSAQLVIVAELGSILWYIDINGISQNDVLIAFSKSEDIRIKLNAVTAGGRSFEGVGYFHPNVQHHAAAIRGDGKLEGYEAH
ncbi:hypothetical protein [Paenibacillus abyssi]|uniref:Uncharacterized protein n=1 Tax=Paenibacillus abyssi TaxID=1340531 RepID=A0A917CVZ6_9BACL|nr:hypothetical protein [Paenibacillus abyssi]GGF99642.1 hypothetical protein GCM10010916_16120 [Paenibacillus abyssi]